MAQDEVHQRGLVIYVPRTVCEWTREELAKAMGTSVSVISDYETGRRRASPRALHRAAAAMGLTFQNLYRLLVSVGDVRRALNSILPHHGKQRLSVAFEEAHREGWEIEDLHSTVVKAVLASLQDGEAFLEAAPAPESGRLLWDQLERLRSEDRRRLVRSVESYWSWDLCELLCEESRDAAEEAEDVSLELADLALCIAERIPGGEELRECAQAFAWAHLGYARRKLGDRSGAEEALARFRQLWHPETSSRALLLDDARIADFEALASGGTGSHS